MLVSVMKLQQLAYCNCIYVGLLLHPFMVVTSSLKWTKLQYSYHLFLILRSEYLIWESFVGEKSQNFGQVIKIFLNQIFKKVKFIRK